MKWIGNRVSYIDHEQKTTFVIKSEEVGFAKALMGAWFGMWLAIGGTIIWSWFTFVFSQQEQIILLVFMAFWCYYFVRVGRSFFWLLYGSERLKMDKIAFTIKNSIRGYGRAKEFYLENIDKVRVSIPEPNSFQSAWENSPWIRGGERLEFDYMGKTIRFGRKLDEQEAKLLFQLITKRLNEYLKKK